MAATWHENSQGIAAFLSSFQVLSVTGVKSKSRFHKPFSSVSDLQSDLGSDFETEETRSERLLHLSSAPFRSSRTTVNSGSYFDTINVCSSGENGDGLDGPFDMQLGPTWDAHCGEHLVLKQ
eukprot:Polyplicarium_translucidae@DN2596_c0_g1_i5.p3